MAIVTLTTDWGLSDHYVAQLKGLILQTSKDVSIIDITHDIPAFNTLRAAFILRNCYIHYPEGSIHLIGVNSEPGAGNKLIAVKMHGHYFIGINDGFFGILFDGVETPKEIVELAEPDSNRGFRALPMFAYAVNMLTTGNSLAALGRQCELRLSREVKANYTDSGISASIIHIDRFGNIVCNVTRELFDRVGKGRAFEIMVQSNYRIITRLDDYYCHEKRKSSDLFALFNSGNLLEIGMYQANMAQLEGLEMLSTIQIVFNNKLF